MPDSRPLALDLCCGSGGVAKGLLQAGYRVLGIDNQPQPDYPGELIKADALQPPVNLAAFALIWASPPCQHDAPMRQRKSAVKPAPNLVPALQDLLAPYPYTVIEQVTPKQLQAPIALEIGTFRDPALYGNVRRRYFQCSWPLLAPPYPPRRAYAPCCAALTGHGHYGSAHQDRMQKRREEQGLSWVTAPEEAAAILGVEHITTGGICFRRERINNALPPEYSRWIGQQAMRHAAEHNKEGKTP